MLTSYAQNLEDVMLWRALKHVEKGCYVDVGAQDPVVDSVSLGFYEQGWRGVHIEPSPHYSQLLREARPDETVMQVAAGASAGVVTLHEIPGTGLSTGDAAIAARHGKDGFEVREVSVPCVTLDDVFDGLGKREIHWLKIDVEGGEKAVLEGWRESPLRPWIVVIESIRPRTTTSSHREWEKLLLDKGYVFAYFDGLNRFYVSKSQRELIKAFSTGPNLFDDFTLSGLATSSFSVRLNDRLQSLQGRIGEMNVARESAERRVAALSDEIRHMQSIVDKERATADQLVETLQRREQEHAERLLTAHTESSRLVSKALDASSASRQQLAELIQRSSAREREYAEQLASLSRELARASVEFSATEADLRSALSASERDRIGASLLHGIRERELERLLDSVQTELLGQAKAAVEQKEALDRRAADLEQRLAAAVADAEAGRLAVAAAADVRERELAQRIVAAEQQAAAASGQLAECSAEQRKRREWIVSWARELDACREALSEAAPTSAAENSGLTVKLLPKDLLGLDDSDFITGVYRVFLARDPDPSGREHFLQLLRSGTSKLEIILQVRYSREGRLLAASTRGLRIHLAAMAVCRLPGLRSVVSGLAKALSALAASGPRRTSDVQARTERDRLLGVNTRFDAEVVRLIGQLRDELASEHRVDATAAGGGSPSTPDSPGLETVFRDARQPWRLGKRHHG